MKKQLEHNLKAERRDLKNRPKMPVHGQNLKKTSKFAGLKLIKASGNKHGKR
ncbi:MAG: hypothetical protein ACM3KM_03165 [Acidobacteriaceae bacterium]